jgi:hypothetical protein
MSAATLEPLYSYATTPEQRADHEAAYQRWSWMTDGAVCGCCNRGRQGFTTEEFPPAFTRVSLHGAPVFDLPHKPPPSGGQGEPDCPGSNKSLGVLAQRGACPECGRRGIPLMAGRLLPHTYRPIARKRTRPPSGGAVDDGATPRPWRLVLVDDPFQTLKVLGADGDTVCDDADYYPQAVL